MTDDATNTELAADDLRHGFDAAALGFDSTEALEPLRHLVGQDRAIEAIGLAAGIRNRRFNLFVHGPEGTGRHTAILSLLRAEAAKRPAPPDWVHVHNFDAPDRPRALALPRGMGPKLRKAMAELVDDLAQGIPALFESEEYQSRRAAIEEEFGGRNEKSFSELTARARERGVAILRTPMGFALAPMKDGEVQKPDVIDKLPEKEREAIRAHVADTQTELSEFLESLPRLEKEHRDAIGALHREMAEQLVDLNLKDLRNSFRGVAALDDYFDALRDDLINNAELFLKAGSAGGDGPFPITPTRLHDQPAFHRYGVNVMVSADSDAPEGAPVVVESLPSLANLIGRIEYQQQMGALVTDVTMIRPGALHRANGGFLVLDAARVLAEPFAWDALKRCLETGEIRIIGASERMGFGATSTLEPDPVPLDLRVALVGDRLTHMLLEAYDPVFSQLFTITAEFGADIDRSADSAALFARLVASVVTDEALRPVSADGVAALLEAAARQADDRTKLSLVLSRIWDILREADYRARDDGAETVTRAHVDATIEATRRRHGRLPERMRENIARGTILIATRGSEVGQINALTVADLGAVRFGWPTRVTARVRLGAGQVIDIERAVKLGGPIHSKGVMILSSYLSGHYLPDTPLSLWASLVFEQSYGGVDGDSASVAELCAILSALAGVPLSQSFAVTGSINQMGAVQPVGGVNEKIEGFFDACNAQGLTGRQGVILPRRNIDNLMLRPDLVAAVAEGRFHVHAIDHVDQAMEILSGLRAGHRGLDGAFPSDSINANVEMRLMDFAEVRRDYGRPPRQNDTGKSDAD
ncbi:MAG: putative ATP-dependent protease [Rhodobacteraceae bacterium HLUCCA12]|nr:MAG: putative ATP-dependent protease [Rhodobacteraceae bacterium HLUCCA12]